MQVQVWQLYVAFLVRPSSICVCSQHLTRINIFERGSFGKEAGLKQQGACEY